LSFLINPYRYVSTGYPAGQGSDSDATNTNATANSATAIDGVGSLDFNGTSAYVNLSQNLSDSLDTTSIQSGMSSAWTASMWVYVESLVTGAQNSYLTRFVDGEHELNLRQADSPSIFQLIGIGITGSQIPIDVDHTGWTNVIMSVTGIETATITTTMYIDVDTSNSGDLTSTPVWSTSQSLYCGAGQNGTARFMSGQIQEVCFWNKELSSANRTALFNGYAYGSATDEDNTGLLASEVEKDNIVAYYTFDAGSVINTAIP